MAFKMKGFPMHNTSALKQTTYKYTTPSGKKIKVKAEGDEQAEVLKKGWSRLNEVLKKYNEFAGDERFGKNLSESEYNQLVKEQDEMDNLLNLQQNKFINTADSLNTVNLQGPFPQRKNKGQLTGSRNRKRSKIGIIKRIKNIFKPKGKQFAKDIKLFAGKNYKKRR